MAKRRTKRFGEKLKEREKRRLEKEANIPHPKGQSRYALKKKGQRKPEVDPNRRPSWFVRSGMAEMAEQIAARNAAWEAAH